MDKLAKKIFDEIFDNELLDNMEAKGLIAQKLGFEISTIVSIQLELEDSYPDSIYPIQPIKDARFEQNPIVNWLCSEVSDMNKISIYAQQNNVDDKYQEQIAQLVGYSIGGYGDLSYVTDESYYRAQSIHDKQVK